MTLNDQNKVKAAGFTIIRKDDYPNRESKSAQEAQRRVENIRQCMRPRPLETKHSRPY